MKTTIFLFFRIICDLFARILFLDTKAKLSHTSLVKRKEYTFAGEDILQTLFMKHYDGFPCEDSLSLYFFSYPHPDIKRSIWSLKYTAANNAVNYFAGLLSDEIIAQQSRHIIQEPFEKAIILFIPSSAYSLGKRSWDQMELLSSTLSKDSALISFATPLPHFFSQNNFLQEQHTLTSKKLRILQGKKRISLSNSSLSHIIAGKEVYIIDDVITTGTTLNSARILCYALGAKNVNTIALSH